MQSKLEDFELPNLSSEDMAFRVYCATGGLIGRLANLLVEAVTSAIYKNTNLITLSDLNLASKLASYDMPLNISDPFSRNFNVIPSEEVIKEIMNIGRTDNSQVSNIPFSYTPAKYSEVLRT